MFGFSTKEATEKGFIEAQNFQFRELRLARNSSAQAVADLMARIRWRGDAEDVPTLNATNAVDDIRRLYKTFDGKVLDEFKPDTEFTLLNDLLPQARSVRLEESVYEYARKGGRGWAHTSMTGQVGAALDAKSYTFDGTMVPIHDSGFKFTWRDPIFQKGSALASLKDAQDGSVDDVRRQYVDYMWQGFRDDDNNFIKFDDYTWKGLRADERVAQVTLTIDFSTSQDPKAMRKEAISLRDVLKLQNYQYGKQTWYVSSEILSNWEQYFDVNENRTVLEEIMKLSGISAIKEDAELSGNEILIVPLAAGVIAPIVGQAFGTVADPRLFYNSDYVWRTWGAAGLMVKQDINGHFSVVYAS
jgi:hypothetical protein